MLYMKDCWASGCRRGFNWSMEPTEDCRGNQPVVVIWHAGAFVLFALAYRISWIARLFEFI